MNLVLKTASACHKLGVLKDNASNMRMSRVSKKKALEGVKCCKISNISTFVVWKLDVVDKACHCKIYTRLRPGFVTLTINNVDIDTFNINREVALIKYSV